MESNRVRETKMKIKDAFLELYKQKRIEKISIKEITTKAHVNRGTFYVYYLDIYDLQEKVEDEAIEEIKMHVLPVIKVLLMNKRLDKEMLPKEFLYKEQAMFELFFGESAEARAVKKIKKIMKEEIIEILGLQDNVDVSEKVKLRYALEYLSSAQLGMMGYWFRNNMELPLEELSVIIEKINLTGAMTYLTEDILKSGC